MFPLEQTTIGLLLAMHHECSNPDVSLHTEAFGSNDAFKDSSFADGAGVGAHCQNK